MNRNIECALQWRHNGRDDVSNHQPHDCLLNRFFRRRSKKTSKLRVTGLCAGNSPVTGEFPAQTASNAENIYIWWRHHGPHNNTINFQNLSNDHPIAHHLCCPYQYVLRDIWYVGYTDNKNYVSFRTTLQIHIVVVKMQIIHKDLSKYIFWKLMYDFINHGIKKMMYVYFSAYGIADIRPVVKSW